MLETKESFLIVIIIIILLLYIIEEQNYQGLLAIKCLYINDFKLDFDFIIKMVTIQVKILSHIYVC